MNASNIQEFSLNIQPCILNIFVSFRLDGNMKYVKFLS